MTTIRKMSLLRVSIVAVVAFLRPPAAVGSELKFRGSFANLDGSAATARLHARITDGGSWMVVRATRLGGSMPLSLLLRDPGVADTVVATFNSDQRGRATLQFRTVPRGPRDLPLGFDPRGKTVVISVGADDRLEVEVPGDDTPPGGGTPPPGGGTPPPGGGTPPPGGGTPPPGGTCTAVDTGDVFLVPQAGAGTAKARFRRDASCNRDFRVEADNVALGTYDVCVGGMAFGSFNVVDNGVEIAGELELDTQPDQPGEQPFPAALPDPLGQALEVRAAAGTSCGGALLFSFASFPDNAGAGPAQPPATCTPVDTGDLFLVPDAGVGKAKARFRRQADCTRDFRVEVEDVQLGRYDVCVGGADFGSLEVVDNGVEIAGELELDTQPNQAGEQPFPAGLPDPLGQRIEVRPSGATPCSGPVLFSFASFPGDPGGP